MSKLMRQKACPSASSQRRRPVPRWGTTRPEFRYRSNVTGKAVDTIETRTLMGNRLEGKTAIIVGGGQQPGETIGNGRATAIRFAQEGARLLLVDISEEQAKRPWP